MISSCKKIEASGIRSLVWSGDDLKDWVGGGRVIFSDGAIKKSNVNYAYKFDAAIVSPCGEYSVIYEKLGTKGLVLSSGKILREINRSFYCAGSYEFPVTIFQTASGRTVLAHCPDEYNELQFEDIETGKRLGKSRKRAPCDNFHSRLRVSGDGKWLISAGWIWHPWGTVSVFDVKAALRDPRVLDMSGATPDIDGEVSSAEFTPDNRILVCTGDESLNGDDADDGAVGPNSLAIFEPGTQEIVSSTTTEETVGSLMPISSRLAVGFHENPKLYSLETGHILERWEDIASGRQIGSILLEDASVPPIALDPMTKRFAVADDVGVSIVHIEI